MEHALIKSIFVDRDSAPTQDGEQFCQVIDFNSRRHIKIASEVTSFLQGFSPKKECIYLHTIALGAGEYYGPNRNGDYFREDQLIKKHRTFVTKAKIYKHHQNKPHNKHYGLIVHSWYNYKMHRVELIIELVIADNPDVISKLERGEGIAFSMGCRVPYDVCMICKNKARTTKEYCKHAAPKMNTDDFLKYGLNKILENGQQICVDNPDPDFFDYSKVFRPADRTAYHLKKVAHQMPVTPSAIVQEKYAEYQEKRAYLRKLSELVKRFVGVPVSSTDSEMNEKEIRMLDKYFKNVYPSYEAHLPPIPPDMENALVKFPMNQILSTFVDNGLFITTPEFIKILFKKMTDKDIEEDVLKKMMRMQGDILKYFSNHPDELEKIVDSGVVDSRPELVNRDITRIIKPLRIRRISIQVIMPMREKTSVFNPLPMQVQRQLGFQPNNLINHTITLPSGETYYSPVSSADTIEDEERLRHTVKKMGLGALPLLGGAILLPQAWKKVGQGSRPWVNTLTRAGVSAPIIGSSLLLAKHLWDTPSSTPYVKTDQGNVVPARAFKQEHKLGLL